jgi:glutathione S-transferase
VNKVRFLLNAIKQGFTCVDIDLFKGGTRCESYAEISMNRKIPCLEDEGFFVSESNTILRYVAQKYKSVLYPENLKERCLVDQWLDFVSIHIEEQVNRLVYQKFVAPSIGVHPSERAMKEANYLLSYHLPLVEKQLNLHRYLTGKDRTIADFCLLSTLDPMEMIGCDLSPYPALLKWRKKLQSEAFYLKCHTSYPEAFENYMAKQV